MANILRPTAEESRRMAIRANQITERCADCGEAYYRGNLIATKVHGRLCSDCFDNQFTASLRRATRCVDCGRLFDPNDDGARCPASDDTAYHRSLRDAR